MNPEDVRPKVFKWTAITEDPTTLVAQLIGGRYELKEPTITDDTPLTADLLRKFRFEPAATKRPGFRKDKLTVCPPMGDHDWWAGVQSAEVAWSYIQIRCPKTVGELRETFRVLEIKAEEPS